MENSFKGCDSLINFPVIPQNLMNSKNQVIYDDLDYISKNIFTSIGSNTSSIGKYSNDPFQEFKNIIFEKNKDEISEKNFSEDFYDNFYK